MGLKWFHHKTSSMDDPDIIEAEMRFGPLGYVIFFKLLEIYGREYNQVDSEEYLTLNRKVIQVKLRSKWITIQKHLDYFQERKRLLFRTDGAQISYKVNNFNEMLPKYEREKRQKIADSLAEKQSLEKEREKEREKDKEKSKEGSSERQETVVQEPLPGNGRNGKKPKEKKEHPPLNPSLVQILDRYPTLEPVNSRDSFQFWDHILTTASYYFPNDEGMVRWFSLQFGNIDTWQKNNPHRASRSRKGLERRIGTWLQKEFMKLEGIKR